MIDGDCEALETLVRVLQGDIYGLVLRMLCNREDAEDATQEILVRIVTRLSQFDFRSKLRWLSNPQRLNDFAIGQITEQKLRHAKR